MGRRCVPVVLTVTCVSPRNASVAFDSHPGVLIAMNRISLRKFAGSVARGGLILYNGSNVPADLGSLHSQIICLPKWQTWFCSGRSGENRFPGACDGAGHHSNQDGQSRIAGGQRQGGGAQIYRSEFRFTRTSGSAKRGCWFGAALSRFFGFRFGARERTRTSTTLRSLAPEASASASSATRARVRKVGPDGSQLH